jgi:hypothetical protein
MGNRNRDIMTCSLVPQPTTLPRAPNVHRELKFLSRQEACVMGKFAPAPWKRMEEWT